MDIFWGGVAATPRLPRGYSARRGRGDAAADTWIFRGDVTAAATRTVQRLRYRSLQTHYDAINLNGAWEITTGDPTVTVQVLDSGLDPDHPDLQKHLWRNEAECQGEAGVDDDNNGFIDDCHGYNHADDTGTDLLGDGSHGTHCSGTVAADNRNDGIGVAGVAGGDGTEDGQGNALTGVRIMTSVGFGKTDVNGFAEGLTYFHRADLYLMNRGDAAADTWIFRGRVAETPRPPRGYSMETSRRGRDVNISWRRSDAMARIARGETDA